MRNGFLQCAKQFFFADSWCAEFCADSYADFWCADFSSTFWRLKKIGIPKSRKKMRRKSAEKSCGVHMALFGGDPLHLRILAQTARHTLSIAARPRTQGEHVRVHRDIFGLKGMLAFAPRFFKNKNQRKIRSANHLPLGLPYSCLRTAGSAPRGQNRHHINGVFKREGATFGSRAVHKTRQTRLPT